MWAILKFCRNDDRAAHSICMPNYEMTWRRRRGSSRLTSIFLNVSKTSKLRWLAGLEHTRMWYLLVVEDGLSIAPARAFLSLALLSPLFTFESIWIYHTIPLPSGQYAPIVGDRRSAGPAGQNMIDSYCAISTLECAVESGQYFIVDWWD